METRGHQANMLRLARYMCKARYTKSLHRTRVDDERGNRCTGQVAGPSVVAVVPVHLECSRIVMVVVVSGDGPLIVGMVCFVGNHIP
jgi:hypothetical protein